MAMLITRDRRINGLPNGGLDIRPWWKRLLTNAWTWIAIGLTAIYAACLGWIYLTTTGVVTHKDGTQDQISASMVRMATMFALPTLLIWIVLYVLLDRYRPQRPLFWWLALGWGGAVSTAASMVINTWASGQLQIADGENPAAGARAAVFVAPFVEEATKASILFLIAIAYRYRLVSKVSGIVLGGLSAAGFAFTENILYYVRALYFASRTAEVGDPEQAVQTLVLMRGYLLMFGHPLFTTMTAIGLMVALRTHSKVVRVLAPLVGYLTAALLHMLFNSGASVLTGDTPVFIYFAVVLPFVLAVVVWVVRRILVEGRRIRARINDYIAMGWLEEEDAYVFSRERSRWSATFKSMTHGWTCFMATLHLQRLITELAYLRDAQTSGTIDRTGDLRAREIVEEVRSVRPLAISDPRVEKVILPDFKGMYLEAKNSLRELRARMPGSKQKSLAPPMYSPVNPQWGPPSS